MHHDWGYRDLTVIVPNLYVFYDPVTDLSEDRRWYICRAVDESSGQGPYSCAYSNRETLYSGVLSVAGMLTVTYTHETDPLNR